MAQLADVADAVPGTAVKLSHAHASHLHPVRQRGTEVGHLTPCPSRGVRRRSAARRALTRAAAPSSSRLAQPRPLPQALARAGHDGQPDWPHRAGRERAPGSQLPSLGMMAGGPSWPTAATIIRSAVMLGRSVSNVVIRTLALRASGRSVYFRSTIKGLPMIVASSWVPPESEMRSRERSMRARNAG